jgi:Skp family chaperone for outer membrane proteins
VKKQIIIAGLAAALLAGCASTSPVGLVDVGRIVANWDTFQNFQQQLLQDEQKISQSKGSPRSKQQQVAVLQKKYSTITEQLTQQIRDAAGKIAAQKGMKLVVTREGVGYGGTDITPDVEKALNITEKATPSPSQ